MLKSGYILCTIIFFPTIVFGCSLFQSHPWRWDLNKMVQKMDDILIVKVVEKENLGDGKLIYQADVVKILKGSANYKSVKIPLSKMEKDNSGEDKFMLFKSTDCQTYGFLPTGHLYIFFPKIENPKSIIPIDSEADPKVLEIKKILNKLKPTAPPSNSN